jgi:hypothetical protein
MFLPLPDLSYGACRWPRHLDSPGFAIIAEDLGVQIFGHGRIINSSKDRKKSRAVV